MRLLIDLLVLDSVFVGRPDRRPCCIGGTKRHMPRYYPYTTVRLEGGSSVAFTQLCLLGAIEEREKVCVDRCYGVMSVCRVDRVKLPIVHWSSIWNEGYTFCGKILLSLISLVRSWRVLSSVAVSARSQLFFPRDR